MKIASWNVNSVAVRMPRVLEFLSEHSPDVLCLQETKSRPEAFPHLELQMAGYVAVDHSSGGRNGVALVVREGQQIEAVNTGLPGEPDPDEARWVEATVNGVHLTSVYVPNGRSLDDPVFDRKLIFLQAMVARAAAVMDIPAVVAGDFNIAPGDADVHDPVRYVGTTHTSRRERAFLDQLNEHGYADVFRELHPELQQFTWWDYRSGNFHKNLGMRIDLFMANQALLADRNWEYQMLRPFRKGTKPSDHAPIMMALTAT